MRWVLREGKVHFPTSGASSFLRRPTIWDTCLLIFLLLLTFTAPRILIGAPGGSLKAGSYIEVHTVDGSSVISLKKDATHIVKGPLGAAKIIIEDGQARMESAPCPLKICEAMGPIKNAGETILCLPNRISIKVTGGEGELDAVSR